MNFLIRIIMAIIAGLIIGVISEHQNQREESASIRIFVIICMGAALVTITSTEFFKGTCFSWTSDPSRLSAQVVSALGFLGTGLMWMSEEERQVKGISEAASLWITAIIGMLIGIGYFSATVIGVLFIIFIYWIYRIIDNEKID